jgi:proteic killer suppression protein
MIVSFNDKRLEDLYKCPIDDLGKRQFSKEVIVNFRKRLDILAYADNLSAISRFKGMNLEKLKGEYKGCYSIRVNIQYRIIFKEVKGGKIEVLILELSKHYE